MNSLLDVITTLGLIVVLCVADILDFLSPLILACIAALIYRVVV